MLSSLSKLSPWVLIFGVSISLISVVQSFVTGKTVKLLLTVLTAALAIGLLFIQAAKDKRSEEAAQSQLQAALEAQKRQITEDLTGAFNTGTNKVIEIAGQEADKTREAASEHEKLLADATLGSNICPQLLADFMSGQRPYALSVFNFDKTANIYDLVVYVQEGEHVGTDGKGFRTLQQKTLRFPTVPAGAGASLPFEFLSQRNTSYLQYSLSTRRKICSGQIVLRGDGYGQWHPESFPVHEGPLSSHNTEVPPQDRP
jgi:type II secretory pathway pseudopilin PulG